MDCGWPHGATVFSAHAEVVPPGWAVPPFFAVFSAHAEVVPI